MILFAGQGVVELLPKFRMTSRAFAILFLFVNHTWLDIPEHVLVNAKVLAEQAGAAADPTGIDSSAETATQNHHTTGSPQ